MHSQPALNPFCCRRRGSRGRTAQTLTISRSMSTNCRCRWRARSSWTLARCTTSGVLFSLEVRRLDDRKVKAQQTRSKNPQHSSLASRLCSGKVTCQQSDHAAPQADLYGARHILAAPAGGHERTVYSGASSPPLAYMYHQLYVSPKVWN